MSFTLDASDFFRKMDKAFDATNKSLVESMHDSVDDLKRISTNIAPIKESILRKSAKGKVRTNLNSIVGEVSFHAVEDGFNYAIWTHEMNYNLGEKSKAAPGTDGYPVGNKYLERPLKGEAEKYVKWWKEAVEKELNT